MYLRNNYLYFYLCKLFILLSYMIINNHTLISLHFSCAQELSALNCRKFLFKLQCYVINE